MKNRNHTELLEIAGAATPGDWIARKDPLGYGTVWCIGDEDKIDSIAIAAELNARFIAAFNPAQVLSMLHELAALRERVATIQRELPDQKPHVAKKLFDALTLLLAAVKGNPSMQGREYVDLGIIVNNALNAYTGPVVTAQESE